MSDFLPHYQKVDPTTWAYLSSLLMIGFFFKFNRIWSVRNLDLLLLIALAPGLILVHKGYQQLLSMPPPPETVVEAAALPNASPPPIANEEVTTIGDADLPEKKARPEGLEKALRLVRNGFLWLLGVSLMWLVRLLLDPTMVRRPLLEPNLAVGGMLFIGVWLYFFLMANVITGQPGTLDLELEGSKGAKQLLAEMAGKSSAVPPVPESSATMSTLPKETGLETEQEFRSHGPGYYFLHTLPRIATISISRGAQREENTLIITTAKVMAILAQLAIVLAMVVIGYWHFDNIRMGIGAATLYLMLPYTAQMTGHVDHALPAALVLWAVVFYRHPLYAGMILGLGMGTSYFALYLLPLWISFYWQRGLFRFLVGVGVSLAILAGLLALTSDSPLMFWRKFQAMFGLWAMAMENLRGIWDARLGGWNPAYRIPILAAFVVLSGFFAAWPAQKNLGTLLSCSAAVMVAAQFWHGYEGGLFIAWYMPLTLLTVFRPNLEDRIALTVLGEGWFPRNRLIRSTHLNKAA
jgi:hypothetical protein